MNEAHEPMNAAPQRSPETNGLGLAGFIVSLVGFLSCGLLSPVGLIMSFIAMFRQPKGLAIAGFVIGLIGSIWAIVIFVFVGIGVLFALIAGLVGGQGYIDAGIDAFEIREAVIEYQSEHQALPSSIGEVTGLETDTLNDHWGRPYRIEIDGQTQKLRVISDGPDGIADTDDDIEIELELD